MLYEVRGVQVSTGKTVRARVEAESASAAIERARRHGLVVADGEVPTPVSEVVPGEDRQAQHSRESNPAPGRVVRPPTEASAGQGESAADSPKTGDAAAPSPASPPGAAESFLAGVTRTSQSPKRWSGRATAAALGVGVVIGAVGVGATVLMLGKSRDDATRLASAGGGESNASPTGGGERAGTAQSSGTGAREGGESGNKAGDGGGAQRGPTRESANRRKRESSGGQARPSETPAAGRTSDGTPRAVEQGTGRQVQASLPPVHPQPPVQEPTEDAYFQAKRKLRLLSDNQGSAPEMVQAAKSELLTAATAAVARLTELGETDVRRVGPLLGSQRSLEAEALLGAWTADGQAASPPTQTTPPPTDTKPVKTGRPVRPAPAAPKKPAPAEPPLVWIIGVDAATGQWQVLLAQDRGNRQAPLLTGEGTDVTVVEGELRLAFKPTKLQTPPFAEGQRLSLRRSGDGIECRADQRTTRFVRHEGKAMTRAARDFWAERAVAAASATAPVIDPSDANEGWWELASLNSAPFERELPGPRQPASSKYTIATCHDGLSPTKKGLLELQSRYAAMERSTYPVYQEISARAQAILTARSAMRDVNNRYGNTPSGSIALAAPLMADVLWQTISYQMSRDEDIQRAGNFDTPPSRQSQERLKTMLSSFERLFGIGSAVERQAKLSRVVEQADIVLADLQMELWKSQLLPLAMKAAGPTTSEPLLEVGAEWKELSDGRGFHSLWTVQARNRGTSPLTHVTLQIDVKNQFGDAFTQFYFIPRIDGDEQVSLLLHPRWLIMSLWQAPALIHATTSVEVECQIWSDQGTSRIGSKGENPRPNPEARKARDAALAFRSAAEDLPTLLAEQAVADAAMQRALRSGSTPPVTPPAAKKK